jgi:hypothetical protein
VIAPCRDCLIIPICRLRYFLDIKNRCELVERFLFKSDRATAREDFEERLNEVHTNINPIHWKKHPLVAIDLGKKSDKVEIGSNGYCLFYWREKEMENTERIKPWPDIHAKNV